MIKTELEYALHVARLPMDPRKVIGRFYQFECEHGSHSFILVGTVLAIGLSDEAGLELYVSNPLFWGKPLSSIMHNNGKWIAYVPVKLLSEDEEERARFMTGEQGENLINEQIASQFFKGKFQLL